MKLQRIVNAVKVIIISWFFFLFAFWIFLWLCYFGIVPLVLDQARLLLFLMPYFIVVTGILGFSFFIASIFDEEGWW